jgi:hypothetical protein
MTAKARNVTTRKVENDRAKQITTPEIHERTPKFPKEQDKPATQTPVS